MSSCELPRRRCRARIAPGVVVDIGADGEVVGIDVDWNLLRAQSRQVEADRLARA
jgi:uncharacterized protein YuzE